MTVRGTILFLLAVAGALRAGETKEAPAPMPRPTVGAIRWDAWSGGPVTAQVERTLGHPPHRFRLPWFARTVEAEPGVEIRGDTDAVMGREIEWAAEAGIDYWAFLEYPEDGEMSRALRRYLAHPQRERVRFCMILHSQVSCAPEAWPAVLQRYLKLFREPGYLRVLDGRPLLYLFKGGPVDAEPVRTRFAELRAAARQANLGDPYIAYMGFNPAADWEKARQMGADAISAYAYANTGTKIFARFSENLERDYWNRARDLQAPCIPLVSTGWDKRPRMDHPVSWEKDHDYHRTRTYVETAQPEEIAAHLKRALAWAAQNPQAMPARTLIVYSWNEYDEGGWIAPTLGAGGKPDDARIRAFKSVLRP